MRSGSGWGALGIQKLFIELESPWQNGYVEPFNGKLRDELLDREIFSTLTERWRQEYKTIRPHGALGYRPPAPEAIELQPPASASLQLAAALT